MSSPVKSRISTHYQPAHGHCVPVIANVQRVTANNPGAMTFEGTNSYIVGDRSVCVIDPGPDDAAHFQALQRALQGRTVTHIVVSHTHRDHSGLAHRLKQATGAVLVAEGPHRLSRPLHAGEQAAFGESGDWDFVPDKTLADGETMTGDGWALETVLTPGHAANHACFALAGTDILFSADHIMAWATTVVAPPDGSMRAYMASLDKLLERPETVYLPGHGGAVIKPAAYINGIKTHRQMREQSILNRIRAGDQTVDAMVASLYRNIDSTLHKPASLSVLAHLEDLVEKGAVRSEGPALLNSVFRPA
ncbi:MBL fold metallo-hydrolase [Rhizobium sp.]|jgi:glyoxylase-like metal-dependent hydrolase (beta-lactamase superfamily II)|uniref:MBL fold metallo-hydrolase n=1 Tax=Rhizobium sp. TaxID=391 RepID=UPI000E7E146C|nr:MBL fold metallo-hydrolase [Rhizobium sp.]